MKCCINGVNFIRLLIKLLKFEIQIKFYVHISPVFSCQVTFYVDIMQYM